MMISIKSCVFDCYETSALLERLAICTLGGAMRHAFVDFECIRVKWLNRAAGLVAEVESAFVGPLRSAFDAAIEAESLALCVDNL